MGRGKIVAQTNFEQITDDYGKPALQEVTRLVHVSDDTPVTEPPREEPWGGY